MSGNKGQGPVPEGQNYESVVLDFLDREMAKVQPTDRKNDHSEDLDALVSDLLKQVISEADQADAPRADYDETKVMLAEFPPTEVGPLELKPRAGTDAASQPIPATRVAPKAGPTALETKRGRELADLEAEAEMELAAIEAQSDTEAETELAALEAKQLGAPEPESEMDLATLEAHSEVEPAVPEVEPAPALPTTGKGHGLKTATKEAPAPAAAAVPKRMRPAAARAEAASESEAAAAPSAADAQGATTPFAVPGKGKSNRPALAVAAACLLAAIGFGAYHFLGGSGETPAALSAAPAVMDSVVVPAAEPAGAEPALVQPKPSIAQPSVARNTVAVAPPVTIKAEAAAPVSAVAPVPAAPRDERPDLLHGTDQIADASRRSAIDGLIPASAPGRAAPAAPRPPRPPKAQAAAPQVSGILVPAVPVSQVSPRYPAIAVRTRTSAVVELDIVVDANGRVIEASPVSGPAMFHKEAVDAAMKWRYRPASIGGSNVQSQTRITMKFNLR